MSKRKKYFLAGGLSLLFISIASFAVEKWHKKRNRMEKQDTAKFAQPLQDRNDPECDSTLWKYVYNPTRLKVIKKCLTVTGVIEESNADDDGDQHMLLKLDAGQKDLLTSKNLKKKNGYLVIEAICMNKINKSKVGDACKGYINHIQIPEVGKHVKVTGSYVIDTHNGWAEIHPITKIKIE